MGLLWTSDQPDAETSDNTHHSQETDMRVPGGIRTRNPGKEAATNPRLRPRGHRDRQKYLYNPRPMNLKHYACLEVMGDSHGN